MPQYWTEYCWNGEDPLWQFQKKSSRYPQCCGQYLFSNEDHNRHALWEPAVCKLSAISATSYLQSCDIYCEWMVVSCVQERHCTHIFLIPSLPNDLYPYIIRNFKYIKYNKVLFKELSGRNMKYKMITVYSTWTWQNQTTKYANLHVRILMNYFPTLPGHCSNNYPSLRRPFAEFGKKSLSYFFKLKNCQLKQNHPLHMYTCVYPSVVRVI